MYTCVSVYRKKINAHLALREQEQGKEMEVCEICGALLVVGDVQQRVDEHIMGKQHMGFARIRVMCDELKEKRQVSQIRQSTIVDHPVCEETSKSLNSAL